MDCRRRRGLLAIHGADSRLCQPSLLLCQLVLLGMNTRAASWEQTRGARKAPLVAASLMHERGPSPPSSSPVLGQSRVAPGCLPTYFCLVAYGSLAIYGFRV